MRSLKVLERALGEVNRVQEALESSRLLEGELKIVLVSEGPYDITSSLLLALSNMLNTGHKIIRASPIEYLTFIAPYSDHNAVFMLSSLDYVKMIADVSRIMIVENLIIAPALPEYLRRMVRGRVVEINLKPIMGAYVASIAFLKTIAKKTPTVRSMALLRDLENLDNIGSLILSHYANNITRASTLLGRGALMASSDILIRVLVEYWKEMRRMGMNVPYPLTFDDHDIVGEGEVIAFRTPFDDHAFKRFTTRLRASRKNVSVETIMFNTDPVLTPLYAIVLFELILDRLNQS